MDFMRVATVSDRPALICFFIIVLVTALSGGPVCAQQAQLTFPKSLQGLWVSDETCPTIKSDEDVGGAGEGILLLKGDKVYSHESLCRINKVLFAAANLAIGQYRCGRVMGKFTLYLSQLSDGRELLVTVFELSSSNAFAQHFTKRCLSPPFNSRN
jgi:hypothetical protein